MDVRIEKQYDIKGSEQKPIDKIDNNKVLQLVGFNLANEFFGVNILKVQEINRIMEITPIPHSPKYVEGVMNLRGKVIPIINLRKRFGFFQEDFNASTRIVVLEVTGQIIGFVVDSVSEVIRIPQNIVEPPPPIVAGISADYIEGVGKYKEKLLILLNLDRLLSSREIDQIRKVA